MDHTHIINAINERTEGKVQAAITQLQEQAQQAADALGLPQHVLGSLAGDVLGLAAFGPQEHRRAKIDAMRDHLAEVELEALLNVAEKRAETTEEPANAKPAARKKAAKKKTAKAS